MAKKGVKRKIKNRVPIGMFGHVYDHYRDGKLTLKEASENLGISQYATQKFFEEYDKYGLEAIQDLIE